MSQNYNLNSNFGLNVSTRGAKTQNVQQSQTENKQNYNIFNSLGNYVDKYENVLNGDIEKEINMYSRQAMIVGMNLKASDTVRRFDVNI